MMKRLIWIMILLALTIQASAQEALTNTTAQSDAPYIYYYSHALNGIVIERADGTDSRIIGQGLVETLLPEAEGPGWSPNGEWFAWLMVDTFYRVSTSAYIISSDGEQIIHFEDFRCVQSMTWSPNGTMIVLRGSLDDYHGNRQIELCPDGRFPLVTTYWLIDLETQQVINRYSVESGNEYGSIQWDIDNDSIHFIELVNGSHILVTLFFDGSIQVEPVSEEAVRSGLLPDTRNDYPILTEENNFENNIYYFFIGEAASPNGHYAPDNNVWLDTNTGQRIDLPLNSSAAGAVISIYWHEDSEWVFLGYDMCFAGCSDVILRSSVFEPSTGYSREITSCGAHSGCVNWLPDYVDISLLPEGQSTSVLPSPEIIDYSFNFMEYAGHLGLFSDAPNHNLLCNSGTYPPEPTIVQDKDTTETVFTLPAPLGESCGQWMGNGDGRVYITPDIVFALSPDEQYYAITDKSELTSLYDAETGERIATLNFYGIELSFSEDSSQLITKGRYAIATWNIEDLLNNRQ